MLNNESEGLYLIVFVHTGTAHQANSITSLLSKNNNNNNNNNTKRPSSKSELDAASVLANMNRISQSPCSDEMESAASGPEITHPTTTTTRVVTNQKIKEEDKENIIEQPEEVATISFKDVNNFFCWDGSWEKIQFHIQITSLISIQYTNPRF